MTAPLALVWHITKKDLRALRWLIALWAALTVLEAVLRVIWPPMLLSAMMWMELNTARWVESVRTLIPFMRALLFTEIVVLLVHADPLVTTDAFWLTRPIAPRVLFFSKLLTTTLGLIVPTCLTQVVLMLSLDVPPSEIVRVIPEILLYTTYAMAILLIGAALTMNQRDLLARMVGLFILTIFIVTLISNEAYEHSRSHMMGLLRHAGVERVDGQLVSEVLFASGFIGAAWQLYSTRRRGRSALIAAATAGAGLLITMHYLPHEVFTEPRQTPLASATPLSPAMHYSDGRRGLYAYPVGEDSEGNCRATVRLTRVQGLRSFRDRPRLTYGFVHRPTGHALLHYGDSFDKWSSDLAAPRQLGGEDSEALQIEHHYVWIARPKRADGSVPEPRITRVSCRDVDVLVKRQTYAPEP